MAGGSIKSSPLNPLVLCGSVGRRAIGFAGSLRAGLEHLGGMWRMFVWAIYYCTIGPLTGKSKLRGQLFPMMSNVGVKSFPIVFLIAALIGAILVLQTGDVLKKYGQINEAPGVVALSMTLELGPLMTAVILAARVGASFTAVLASMKINDELLALETMAIHPVGYLVAPRFLSMVIMVPCLTVMAYLVGMLGGSVVAFSNYDIPTSIYVLKTTFYLEMKHILSGLMKSEVFGVIIAIVCCYNGFITTGGPMGLGRSTMVAVVTSLVLIIVADAILTAVVINYIL
ncbi:MAG: MlaE family lipid ABC transporter permease subunit [Phycisphaera sp.]|nr:MlaE family lipid ABC transporter permease subunit [Phycisphaera sp.]